MYRLQREAKKVKKELAKIHVEAEATYGAALVKVVVTAELEIVSIEIDPSIPSENVPTLLIDALNRALKKAQVVASEKMRGIMGEMGMPTMGE